MLRVVAASTRNPERLDKSPNPQRLRVDSATALLRNSAQNDERYVKIQ